MAKDNGKIFKTNKRIRLGIWGLGRGMSFFQTCSSLNIDVVAGCDYVPYMRERFARDCPGAFVTDNEDEFLARDFDAVLLATYCPAHAKDAIKALAAGKHVLSEVTAFYTLAEGVALVEAVQKSGKVYNLAENYPFQPSMMWLRRQWAQGLFGELQYAEFEYVHECRSLCYTYNGGGPVQPGHLMHSWRSWLNFHYYCTHSLGPIMYISGQRPTRVVALPGRPHLAGYPVDKTEGMGGATPSLINMSNGSVVRNLMGATTNDTHSQRIWGTLGAAELGHQGLVLRLGGGGSSPKMPVTPALDELGQLAAKTGHGGGDFWVMYYFARQILTGEKAPWDIYAAADVTIPGILAVRSSMENGQAYDVPNFRHKAQRDRHRNDHWGQKPLAADAAFPKDADRKLTQHFSATMANLIGQALAWRAYADWSKVSAELHQGDKLMEMLHRVVHQFPALKQAYAAAQKLIRAYPASRGARVLREMLEVGGGPVAASAASLARLKRELAALRRKHGLYEGMILTAAKASALLPRVPSIEAAAPPKAGTKLSPIPYDTQYKFLDIRPVHAGKNGLVYVKGRLVSPKGAKGNLLYGSDGPVKVWVNGKAVGCQPAATNPSVPDQYSAAVAWKKGPNSVVFAIHSNSGNAWGIIARGVMGGE